MCVCASETLCICAWKHVLPENLPLKLLLCLSIQTFFRALSRNSDICTWLQQWNTLTHKHTPTNPQTSTHISCYLGLNQIGSIGLLVNDLKLLLCWLKGLLHPLLRTRQLSRASCHPAIHCTSQNPVLEVAMHTQMHRPWVSNVQPFHNNSVPTFKEQILWKLSPLLNHSFADLNLF